MTSRFLLFLVRGSPAKLLLTRPSDKVRKYYYSYSVINVLTYYLYIKHCKETSTESLLGRIFELNLADLNKDEDQSFRKLKFRVEDVQGTTAVTNFYGMSLTRDKLCSLIKKWQSLIEASVDVTTTDGYRLRVFAIGFTKKQSNQEKKTCYAKSSQYRAIRKKMVDIITENAQSGDLRALVQKIIPGAIGAQIEKAVQSIFPMKDVYLHKIKMLKSPKFDLTKLMEVHTASAEEAGAKVDRPEAAENPTAQSGLVGSGGRL